MYTNKLEDAVMITVSDVREGSLVMVRGNFGGGFATLGKVLEVEDDIKNGLPGIGYIIEKETHGNWAYMSQVDSVVKY